MPPIYSMEYTDSLRNTSSLGLHEPKSHVFLALKGPSEIISDNSFTDGPKNGWSLLLLRSPSTLMVKLHSHSLTLSQEYFP